MDAQMKARMDHAMDGAHCKTGPSAGYLKAKCPKKGTDAAIYWQAVMWAVNPHRVSITQMVTLSADQQQFFDFCEAWVRRLRAKKAE